MENVIVVKVIDDEIYFSDGTILSSEHSTDCCESHYLSMSDLSIDDFKGLEFDLTTDKFFNRITDYGIELIPLNGHSVRIPAYAYNNGYYSDELTLVLRNSEYRREFDITDCQDWSNN